MKTAFYLVVFSSLLAFSCTNSPKLCSNQTNLISAHDSLPIIHLDFELSDSQLEEQIRTLTADQDPKLPQKFGLQLNGKIYNSSIHGKHTNLTACYGMPAMMHRSPQLEIFITGNNMALMEGKDLIPLDSITSYIGWYFPHDKPYGEKIVKLGKSPLASNIVFKRVVDEIAHGYLRYYDKNAALLYNKTVCQLDSLELISVSKRYPFELRFWIGDPSNLR